MAPLIGTPGWPELLIILAVVLILFGGSRLAGLGKSTGRALREFKDETKGLTGDKNADKDADADPQITGTTGHQAASGHIVEPTANDLSRSDQPQATPETRRDV